MSIDTLHRKAIEDNGASERELFHHLTVSFRIFAQQRIWNAEDSEEVVQDALMTISSKYRAIEFTTSFAAWAYRVLNHKILDYVKAKKVRKAAAARLSERAENPVVFRSDPGLKASLIRCLRKISSANRNHARILNLNYQGFTTEEICDKLEIKPNNLYVMLSRARSMLELCLEEGDTER